MSASPARYVAMILVLAAVGYTALLCFVHTNAFPITNAVVAVTDGAVVMAALGLALWRAPMIVWTLVFAVAVNFLALALLAGSVELKAVRDVLVLVAFGSLGLRFADALAARLVFTLAAAVVVAFCLIELFAPALFTRFFDIFDFYAQRGVLTAEQIQYQGSSFFVSGERGDGRLIAPWLTFLGDHRASSVFLEPVSLGNFGAIAAAFALALPRTEQRYAWAFGAVALITIFAADARFAAASLVLFLLVRVTPLAIANMALAFLPIAAIAILLAISAFLPVNGDTLLGRLSHSGAVLATFDLGTLFGLRPHSVATVDSGYAYALANFGLPLCVLLWTAFVAFPTRNETALRFKLLLGAYACALLCVSGSSLFSLKTGAIAMFVLGGLAAHSFAASRELRQRPSAQSVRTAPA